MTTQLPVPAPVMLPAAVIDSHVHLDLITDFSGLGVADGLSAAADAGVAGVIQIGVDLQSSKESVDLARQHERVLGAAVGLHPNEAPERIADGGFQEDLQALAELAMIEEVIAVGETGLDFFRTGPEGTQSQVDSFKEHIRLAREFDLTLVIHDRDAHSAVLDVLESEDLPQRVVFHCFSGDAAMARVVADAGWFLSFSGVVTFKNAPDLRAALEVAPADLILVETDAPFLTPTPNRGKPNASYLMPNTVREMAQLRAESLEALCSQVTDNTRRAFALGISTPDVAGG